MGGVPTKQINDRQREQNLRFINGIAIGQVLWISGLLDPAKAARRPRHGTLSGGEYGCLTFMSFPQAAAWAGGSWGWMDLPICQRFRS